MEIGEFSFLGRDLGLRGVIYICEKRNSGEEGFFLKIFRGEEQRERKRTMAAKTTQVCFATIYLCFILFHS